MKMMHLTRRGFLRAACVVAGGAMISLRMAGVAVAAFRKTAAYPLGRPVRRVSPSGGGGDVPQSP